MDYDAFFNDCAEKSDELGIVIANWSCTNSTNGDTMSWYEIPYPDATKLRYALHWGPGPVEVSLPENPTWGDLWVAADQAIRLSTDLHHVFVEKFTPMGDGVYELQTGS